MILSKEFREEMKKAGQKALNFPIRGDWYWFMQEHKQEYKDFIAMYLALDNI